MGDLAYGICAFCRTEQRLRKDGTLRGHPNRWRNRCEGSRMAPAGPSEPLASVLIHRLEQLPTRSVDGRAMVAVEDLVAAIEAVCGG